MVCLMLLILASSGSVAQQAQPAKETVTKSVVPAKVKAPQEGKKREELSKCLERRRNELQQERQKQKEASAASKNTSGEASK